MTHVCLGSFSIDRRCLRDVRFRSDRFSNGVQGQALSDQPPPIQCRCRSRARASLRNRHQALPSWELKTRRNNLPSGLAVTNGRSKRSGELTSSIVPRGTSFHRRVELEFPPIGCDPAGVSRCYGLFPGPSELGAVNPNAVQDHGQAACQSHDRLFYAAAPGDLHRPGLEPRPLVGAGSARPGPLRRARPHHLISAA